MLSYSRRHLGWRERHAIPSLLAAFDIPFDFFSAICDYKARKVNGGHLREDRPDWTCSLVKAVNLSIYPHCVSYAVVVLLPRGG